MTADLRETLSFALLPARYADPSWWEADWLPAGLFERLREHPRSVRHLSSFFLKRVGLTGTCPLDVESPEARLALTPPAELDRRVRLAGITVRSPALARVLRGTDRRAIVAAIGAADYDFAIRRGRLLLLQARLAEAATDLPVPDFEKLDEECRAIGVAALAAALQRAPEEVIRRTQLKLSRGLVERSWRPLMPQPAACLRLFELLGPQAGSP